MLLFQTINLIVSLIISCILCMYISFHSLTSEYVCIRYVPSTWGVQLRNTVTLVSWDSNFIIAPLFTVADVVGDWNESYQRLCMYVCVGWFSLPIQLNCF